MDLIKNRKVILISILAISILIIFLLNFNHRTEPLSNQQSGPYVDVMAVEGVEDEGFGVEKVANDSGMSGYSGKNHVHSNNERDMWKVSGDTNENISITFDFGKPIPVDEMWIWNYNAHKNEDENWGLKDVQIYYSTDNKNWQEWKGDGYPYRLAPGSGSKSLSATNLDDGNHSPIRFEGTVAKYVRIVASNEPGKGNWADSVEGDSYYGVSEVRFYRYKEEVVVGGSIMPISVSTTGETEELTDVENIINRFGMKDTSTHGNEDATMWLGRVANGEEFSLTFDLGGTYPIEAMKVWNYNHPDKLDAGLRNVRILYSLDGENWEELNQAGTYFELAMSSGEEELTPTNINDDEYSVLGFNGVQAKYVRIIPHIHEGNWGRTEGNSKLYGLSEVAFVAAPGIAVEPADEWTTLFSNYQGWTGADGTYSLPLNKDTLFLFSDTYVGNVHPVTKQRDQPGMVNNSLAILEGDQPILDHMEFIFSSNTGDLSIFTPKTANSIEGSWYWLQDGIVLDKTLYLFPITMVDDPSGDAGFQFAISGVHLISVPITEQGLDLENQLQIETPLFQRMETEDGNILFGAAVLLDKDYVYVYGYKDFYSGKKDLVVARVKSEQLKDFSTLEYWTGKSWTSDILNATILIEEVSPELSVDYMEEGPYAGKYVAVFEKDSISGYIQISTSDTPYGPFTEPETIYFIPEANNDSGIITYNAKAHPNLSNKDELLISYNVNSTLPNGNMANGDIYRPRWVKVRELLDK